MLEEHHLLLAAQELKRRFDDLILQRLLHSADERDARIRLDYDAKSLAVRDFALDFTAEEADAETEEHLDFRVVREGPERADLVLSGQRKWTCWHKGKRGEKDKTLKLAECREHLLSYLPERDPDVRVTEW